MIDPKKYEGHTPGPWGCDGSGYLYRGDGKGPIIADVGKIEDRALIADAPELLAEVVRLRAALRIAVRMLDQGYVCGHKIEDFDARMADIDGVMEVNHAD